MGVVAACCSKRARPAHTSVTSARAQAETTRGAERSGAERKRQLGVGLCEWSIYARRLDDGLRRGRLMAFATAGALASPVMAPRVASEPRRSVMAIVVAPPHDATRMTLDLSKRSRASASGVTSRGPRASSCGQQRPAVRRRRSGSLAERALRELVQGRKLRRERERGRSRPRRAKAYIFGRIFGVAGAIRKQW